MRLIDDCVVDRGLRSAAPSTFPDVSTLRDTPSIYPRYFTQGTPGPCPSNSQPASWSAIVAGTRGRTTAQYTVL